MVFLWMDAVGSGDGEGDSSIAPTDHRAPRPDGQDAYPRPSNHRPPSGLPMPLR